MPLGASTATVPAALRKLVWAAARDQTLKPVARIRTERTVRHLIDATGQVLVEVADDRVQAQRMSGSASVPVDSWREIEVELRGGDRGWLDAVDAALKRMRD